MTALTAAQISGATLFANRSDALASWPKGATVAELGVGFGAYSAQIIERTSPVRFDAYDLFKLHEIETLWGQPSKNIFHGKTQRAFYADKFAAEISAGRMRIVEGDSAFQLQQQPPASYDVIYIDGDHTEKGVRRDTEAAVRAIKPGGLLVFNDYVLYDRNAYPYGVIPIVNDLCVNHGWRAKYLAMHPQMFCDIAIYRSTQP